ARFRERCFTEAERAYCDSRSNPAQSYAGRFAGKEAVGKALGFGVARAFAWQEVEIVGRPKPAVRLSGRLAERAAALGVVAVDIPSGVNASTGEVAGAAVQADLTVTMHGPKVGLAVAPGRFHAGEIAVAEIGLEPAETEHRLVTPEILAEVPRRSSRDNKYTAGHVLV